MKVITTKVMMTGVAGYIPVGVTIEGPREVFERWVAAGYAREIEGQLSTLPCTMETLRQEYNCTVTTDVIGEPKEKRGRGKHGTRGVDCHGTNDNDGGSGGES